MNECPRHKLPRILTKQKCFYCGRIYAACKACQDEIELLEINETCPRCYVSKGLVDAKERKSARDIELRSSSEKLEELQKKYDKAKLQLQSLVKQYKDLKGFQMEKNEIAPQAQINSLKTQLESTRMSFNEMEKLYVHLDELSANLDTLVDTKESNSDLVIECASKRFRAHSLLLSSRSSVFKQMTKQALMDKSFRLKVDDMKPEILKEVLHYMYSGRCNVDEFNALDMYIASERFQLRSLKHSVENYLIDVLNKRNALDILKAFDKYHNHRMKAKSIQTINLNYQEIYDTIEWSKLKIENPDLVYQVYESKIQKL